jgi:hypothetical protein
MDEGATADELLRDLRAIAETDLPQPLTYLIGDVQRRHGNLVVLPASSCVRSEDESLLVEVAAHRGLRALRPMMLAPTVMSFQADAASVLAALRAAGYLPVPADETGVVDLRRDATLAGSTAEVDQTADRVVDRLRELGSGPPDVSVGQPGPALVDLAGALLAAARTASIFRADAGREPSETESMIDAFGVQLDPVERRQLAYAIEHQLPVQLTYQSASGGITSRVISDIELEGGLLHAWCHLRDDDRVFAIDRIQAVVPVRA